MTKSFSAWQVSVINKYLQVFLCNIEHFLLPLASLWYQDDLCVSKMMHTVGENPNPSPKSLKR